MTALWKERTRDKDAQQLRGLPGIHPSTRIYQREVEDGHLTVMVSREDKGWHLSISHRRNLLGPGGRNLPGRYPTWDEMRDARYDLIPDPAATMAFLLPPKDEYVNVMPTCFHLWEVRSQ